MCCLCGAKRLLTSSIYRKRYTAIAYLALFGYSRSQVGAILNNSTHQRERVRWPPVANSVEIVADSISTRGHRLTTMVVTLPRIVLAEFNTHRMLSRNSASSRAIPVRRQMEAIVHDTFTPVQFGTAIAGMNAGPPLSGDADKIARQVWEEDRDAALWYSMVLTTSVEIVQAEWDTGNYGSIGEMALSFADRLETGDPELTGEGAFKVSKGLTNRLLEPFAWQTIIVTATEWDNFFALRTDSNAQEEIRTPAQMMLEAYNTSTPVLVKEGGWHMPFIQELELEWALENPEIARKVVSARCARVSYKTHDKEDPDLKKDVAFADWLAGNGHMSPFEHTATPLNEREYAVRSMMSDVVQSNAHLLSKAALDELTQMPELSGNFRGWSQYRREHPNQRVYVKPEPESESE